MMTSHFHPLGPQKSRAKCAWRPLLTTFPRVRLAYNIHTRPFLLVVFYRLLVCEL